MLQSALVGLLVAWALLLPALCVVAFVGAPAGSGMTEAYRMSINASIPWIEGLLVTFALMYVSRLPR